MNNSLVLFLSGGYEINVVVDVHIPGIIVILLNSQPSNTKE